MVQLPENNKEYNTLQYWEKRYQEEESHGKVYDWFGDFTLFEETLIEFLPSDKEKSIIHLGCGNSICGERLYKAGFQNIVNVDYSPTVIRNMKTMNEGICPDMDWIVADIFDLKSALGDHLFDIAIDKGTLDSFLTISHDPWNPPKELLTKMENYMKSVALQLKPGGRFLHLTWAQPHFRKRFLELSKDFIVTSHTISKGAGGFDYFLYEAVKM